MKYSIKKFAKMFNTTEHTIRYYTDIEILPCLRDEGNRRIFDEESANWMQGITCLKSCGASIEDIKEYCDLCKMPETKENLWKRYQIFLRQEEKIQKKREEIEITASYMRKKIKHYEEILSGVVPDDSNPEKWTLETKPDNHKK